MNAPGNYGTLIISNCTVLTHAHFCTACFDACRSVRECISLHDRVPVGLFIYFNLDLSILIIQLSFYLFLYLSFTSVGLVPSSYSLFCRQAIPLATILRWAVTAVTGLHLPAMAPSVICRVEARQAVPAEAPAIGAEADTLLKEVWNRGICRTIMEN